MLHLAQTDSTAVGRALLWIGFMIGALVVLSVVLVALRRRLLRPDPEPAVGMFEHLRRMKAEGTITEEEYDAVRRRMASRLAGRDELPPPAASPAPADAETAKLAPEDDQDR